MSGSPKATYFVVLANYYINTKTRPDTRSSTAQEDEKAKGKAKKRTRHYKDERKA